VSPVLKGASNPDLFCGSQRARAQSAEALVAPAKSGSIAARRYVPLALVRLHGFEASCVQWPHNTGPLMIRMASCGDGTCNRLDPTNAQGFKIDQVGKKSDGKTLVQADISAFCSSSRTHPDSRLIPGYHLVRHEIIVLHLAATEGSAEFF
ncbi:uncharacterized protein BXZ73DRAFT_2000, partial [Epithele typhae]|uniref:uncharacterized protein n=1 Tax=Epithele typhae TaxID=378194 RepID=UPI00200864A5